MCAAVAPEQIDALFAEWDHADCPGAALGIIQDGDVIYSRGYGCANLEYGIPITPASVFYTGSVSKQFTAMAILLLAQQGALTLDDPIRRYVPELPEYCDPVSLRHLIHHTGGIRDYWTLFFLAGKRHDDAYTNEDMLATLRRQKRLNFAPGSGYAYSNSGYALLAMLVQRVAGKTLREYADEQIFGPLGMRATHYRDDHTTIVPNRAYGYALRDGGGYGISIPNSDIVGAGGVMSTVADLARWDDNFYRATVGGSALVAQMQVPGAMTTGEPLDYACGLHITTYRGIRMVAHAGGFGGYHAQLLRFPEQRFSVVCLCNRGDADPTALACRIADLYLEERLAPREPGDPAPDASSPTAAPAAAADLRQYAGTYSSEELETHGTIAVEDAALLVTTRSGQKLCLQGSGTDTFTHPWPLSVRFTRGPRGDLVGFDLTTPRVQHIEFVRQHRGR